MGCTTSRPLVVNSDDVVRKCKDRRLLIHNAMKHRQDFTIAHIAYIQSLRNTGFALRRFAEGEISDVESSPRTPNTPVLALPQPLSPRVGALSPSLPSSSPASTFSPPPSSPSNLNLNPNQPSTPPLAIPVSPPLSPIRLSSDPFPFSPSSPPPYLHDASPSKDNMDTILPYSLNDMESPDRGGELTPPYYSPTRDDLDDALVAYSPPPLSSLLTDSSWFSFDIFTPPLIPYHLQEHRRMKRVGEMEDEDILAYNKVQEDEGMPDLEEVEPKEDEAGQDDRDKLEEAVSEEIDKGVASEEKVEPSNAKIDEDGSVRDNMEKDQVVVVSTVQKEVAVAENDGKEKTKKEVGVATTLKERNLTEAVRHIDDQFARACKSGEDVSRMLETQMHYHSRISGLKDSSKVFNAITSHWARKTSSATRDAYEDNDASECGMAGSHASTLERLYAWEKKLYDEVKTGESIRMAFDQKFKEVHNLDAKGGDSIVLDKMRASLKKLDMQLMVAIRAIHVTSTRIQGLTNEELYPQLYELLGGLVSMWKMMLECHQAQQAIALEMQTLENSVAGGEASEAHKKATIELGRELKKWQSHFQSWIWSQKKYINDLHKWLERCYETRESSTSGKKVSSEWTEKAPIFWLLKGWMESLVGLETKQKVINSIRSFAAVICSLEENQSNELKLKKQVERSSKLLDQQTLSLKKLEKKHVEGRANTTNGKLGTSDLTTKNKLQEKRARLDQHRTLVENEKHKHSAAVQVRRNTTLDLLKQYLPTVFESMASFAEDAQKMYEKIQEKTEVVSDSPNRENEVVGDSPNRENGATHQILE